MIKEFHYWLFKPNEFYIMSSYDIFGLFHNSNVNHLIICLESNNKLIRFYLFETNNIVEFKKSEFQTMEHLDKSISFNMSRLANEGDYFSVRIENLK